MRVAVCTPTFLPTVGGAELAIHEIYRRIGRRHDVTVLAPAVSPHVTALYGATDYAAADYDVVRVVPGGDWVLARIGRQAAARTSAPYLHAAARLAATRGIDVMNLHYIRPFAALAFAGKRLGHLPIAVSLVGRSDVIASLGPAGQLYARLMLRNAAIVLPNSTFYLGTTTGSAAAKARVVPYGVDTAEFVPRRGREDFRRRLGIVPGEFVLLAVQRLAEIKRVDLLIEVVARLRGRGANVRLIIGGQGEKREVLRALASGRGIGESVSFVGYVSRHDLPNLFGAADAYVSHSMMETFGIVFAQAMAAGLPIVAAASSCVPHVLRSSNAVLVSPFDLDRFVAGVEMLMNNRARTAAMSGANRARAVAEFDWDLIAQTYEDILAELVARSGRRSHSARP